MGEPTPPGLISVIVPVHGYSHLIDQLCDLTAIALKGHPYEIILLDDRSPDQAWDIITRRAQTDPAVRGVRLERNVGQTDAMVLGLSEASGERIVFVDADLDVSPAAIPLLINGLDDGADMASGIRTGPRPALRRIPSLIVNRSLRARRWPFRDIGCAFIAIDRRLAEAFLRQGELKRGFRFKPTLHLLADRHDQIEVPSHETRASSYSLRSLVTGWVDAEVALDRGVLAGPTLIGAGMALVAAVAVLVTSGLALAGGSWLAPAVAVIIGLLAALLAITSALLGQIARSMVITGSPPPRIRERTGLATPQRDDEDAADPT